MSDTTTRNLAREVAEALMAYIQQLEAQLAKGEQS